jgi:hypothetical protein
MGVADLTQGRVMIKQDYVNHRTTDGSRAASIKRERNAWRSRRKHHVAGQGSAGQAVLVWLSCLTYLAGLMIRD